MTVTNARPSTEQAPRPAHRRGLVVTLAAGVLAAAGLGVGLAVSLGGSSPSPTSSAGVPFDYYESAMSRYGIGSMMGGDSYAGAGRGVHRRVGTSLQR